MNAEAARAQVFEDTLACEETRPAAFVAGALDAAAVRKACLRAEGLLRALTVVEDSRAEEPEEHGAQEAAMHRIEAKLDLLTALVASRFGEHTDPPRPLHWSARGARIEAEAVAAGTRGALRVQPSDWLPESMLLPATVLAVEDGYLWLRFDALPPTLESALERHLFRIHRRAIAESRRAR